MLASRRLETIKRFTSSKENEVFRLATSSREAAF